MWSNLSDWNINISESVMLANECHWLKLFIDLCKTRLNFVLISGMRWNRVVYVVVLWYIVWIKKRGYFIFVVSEIWWLSNFSPLTKKTLDSVFVIQYSPFSVYDIIFHLTWMTCRDYHVVWAKNKIKHNCNDQKQKQKNYKVNNEKKNSLISVSNFN